MASWMEPPTDEQRRILSAAVEHVVAHGERAEELSTAPVLDASDLRRELGVLDPDTPLHPAEALDLTVRLLTDGTVHTTNPSYFGLFNPTPSFMGIVGDLLTAAFNPQLAAWSHAPAANEIEAWLVRYLADRLGMSAPVAGSFTAGGAEANAQALHLALTRAFPEFGDRGLRAVEADPVVYASSECHHAWLKIAHVCGIGRNAVRLVPAGQDLRMDITTLDTMTEEDQRNGRRPVLVVATAGTTSAGVIDPLADAAALAAERGAWCHIDAAWAGAACLSDSLRTHLAGIERADSVTVDAHKWLSTPMGAGVFITTEPEALQSTYRIATSYMPTTIDGTVDPYTSSNQWSRRFIGLKLFLTLITVGRSGYAAQIEQDTALADRLRSRLAGRGWNIVNVTPFPVVCITDPAHRDDVDYHQRIVDNVLQTGSAWISSTMLGSQPAIRICVMSHRTTERHTDRLIELLEDARTGAAPR
jgi:aromatic-L-amino-acid/L-tryptophan decarboxylase